MSGQGGDPQTEEPMLEHFEYGHLPEGPMRAISAQFAGLAYVVCDRLPRTPERTVALRKLLEGKDAAVRCAKAVAKAAGDSTVGHERVRVDSPELRQSIRYEDPGRPPGACPATCGILGPHTHHA
jgi:hypothetical protein